MSNTHLNGHQLQANAMAGLISPKPVSYLQHNTQYNPYTRNGALSVSAYSETPPLSAAQLSHPGLTSVSGHQHQPGVSQFLGSGAGAGSNGGNGGLGSAGLGSAGMAGLGMSLGGIAGIAGIGGVGLNTGASAGVQEDGKIYNLVIELMDPSTRETALLELSKKREQYDDLALVLWHSLGKYSSGSVFFCVPSQLL